MSDEIRERVRELAAASSDGMSWFDDLYAAAKGDIAQIPWAEHRPNKNLTSWLDRERPSPRGETGRALKTLVVGCGLGEDAELLSRWQFDVTAFDLSPTAIDWCKRRYPSTRVKYHVGDLFTPPASWIGAWDFVFEAYTVQPLPMTMRADALSAVARLVAPGGQLLLISRGRDVGEEVGSAPPWPLTHNDLRHLADVGQLRMASFEDYVDDEEPPVRRFRVLCTRA